METSTRYIDQNPHPAENARNYFEGQILTQTPTETPRTPTPPKHTSRNAITKEELDDAECFLGWIRRHDRIQFRRRELWQAMKGGRFRKVADLEGGLEALVRIGVIERVASNTPVGAGRPPRAVYRVLDAELGAGMLFLRGQDHERGTWPVFLDRIQGRLADDGFYTARHRTGTQDHLLWWYLSRVQVLVCRPYQMTDRFWRLHVNHGEAPGPHGGPGALFAEPDTTWGGELTFAADEAMEVADWFCEAFAARCGTRFPRPRSCMGPSWGREDALEGGGAYLITRSVESYFADRAARKGAPCATA